MVFLSQFFVYMQITFYLCGDKIIINMKKILSVIGAIICSAMVTAQNLNQFKALDDSLFRNNESYVKSNKYQRDAMLFVDMLADTHPYYIKKERRDELFAKQGKLLDDCLKCNDDSTFAELLGATLGELRDKHTDVIALGQLEAKKNKGNEIYQI